MEIYRFRQQFFKFLSWKQSGSSPYRHRKSNLQRFKGSKPQWRVTSLSKKANPCRGDYMEYICFKQILNDENPARSLVFSNKFVLRKKGSKNARKILILTVWFTWQGDRNRHGGDGRNCDTHHAMTFRGHIPTNSTAGLISLVWSAPTMIQSFYHLW